MFPGLQPVFVFSLIFFLHSQRPSFREGRKTGNMIPTVALVMLIIVVVICSLTLAIAIWHTITTRLELGDSEEASPDNDKVPLTKPEVSDVPTAPVRSITPEAESPPPLAGEESVYVLPPPRDSTIAKPVNSPCTNAPSPSQLNRYRPFDNGKPTRPYGEKVPFVLMDPPKNHHHHHRMPQSTPVSNPPDQFSKGSRPLKPSPFQAQPDRTRPLTGPPRLTGNNRHVSGPPQGRSNPRPARGRGGSSPRLAGPFHQRPRDRDSMHDIIDLYTSEARSLAPMPHSAPPRTTTFAEATSKWAYFGRVEEKSMV